MEIADKVKAHYQKIVCPLFCLINQAVDLDGWNKRVLLLQSTQLYVRD